MDRHLNVVNDPVFEVVKCRGGVIRASIREILQHGVKFEDFAGTPMDQATAMNTTIAVAEDLGCREKKFSWENTNLRRYDMDVFMQQPGLDTNLRNKLFPWNPLAKDEVLKEIGYCHPRIPVCENESYRMRPHPVPGEYELCERCCAVGLLANPLFARMGGAGNAVPITGVKTSPLYVWKMGDNLEDFVAHNYRGQESAAWDQAKIFGDPFKTGTLGRPDNPRLLTVNQTRTLSTRMACCHWIKPTMQCLICGEDQLYHAKEVAWTGIAPVSITSKALEKGYQKLHNCEPHTNYQFNGQFRVVVPAADPKIIADLNSTHPNDKIVAAATEHFGERWKAIGMRVEKIKKAEIAEQFLITPDEQPERRVFLGDKPPKVAPFLPPAPKVDSVLADRVRIGVAGLKEINRQTIEFLRDACYAGRTDAAEVRQKLYECWKRVYPNRTNHVFKRVFFEVLLAYACNPVSGNRRPKAEVLSVLKTCPCSSPAFGALDWVHVMSVLGE